MLKHIFAFILFTYAVASSAENLTHKISDDLIIQAEYIDGGINSPVVILIPPFLQTKNFYTIKRLADSLSESGLNVLIPTISYGISLRNKPLECAAIHTHSLDDDIEEINYWVDLMMKKSARKVILLGHSLGATQALHFALNQPDKISKLILLSLGYFGAETPLYRESEAMIAKVQKQLDNNNNQFDTFSLSYCKKYLTTPKNYLSYTQYNKKHTLMALKTLNMPLLVVVGRQDINLKKEWGNSLLKTNINVVTIKQADHFFDNEAEFSLLDLLETFLELS